MTTFDNPAGVPAPPPGRYSHVAVVDVADKKFLILSGQIATGHDGALVGPGDMAAQASAIFDQIGTILAAHGATFEHVVNLRTYLTDIDRIADYRTAHARHFNPATPPTSTLVEVSRLAVPGALIEVEVTAIV